MGGNRMSREASGLRSENRGWISFASTGANPHKVKTSWTAQAPAGTPSDLTLATGGGIGPNPLVIKNLAVD